MKISPISFGRAIKINSNEKVANAIATAANYGNYGLDANISERTPLQKFAQNIFNDTHLPNGKAKVFIIAPGEVCIFSGREAYTANRLIRQTSAQIDINNAFVNGLPDRYCRAEQRQKYSKINQDLIADRNRKIASLIEDGKEGKPQSLIEVELEETEDTPNTNLTNQIKKVTYISTEQSTKEQVVYTKTM